LGICSSLLYKSFFFSNRSLAYINRELYGLALEDADVAISIDPAFAKAYFRRASANMAMGKFKLALKDYEKVRDLRPNDKDVQKKVSRRIGILVSLLL